MTEASFRFGGKCVTFWNQTKKKMGKRKETLTKLEFGMFSYELCDRKITWKMEIQYDRQWQERTVMTVRLKSKCEIWWTSQRLENRSGEEGARRPN